MILHLYFTNNCTVLDTYKTYWNDVLEGYICVNPLKYDVQWINAQK
jgi:hypothetical protein